MILRYLTGPAVVITLLSSFLRAEGNLEGVRFKGFELPLVPENPTATTYISGIQTPYLLSLSPEAFWADVPEDLETRFSLTDDVTADVVFNSVEVALVGRPLNYPNPFPAKGRTEIGFELKLPSHITLTFMVYDMFGHMVCKKVVETSSLVQNGNYFRIPFSSDDTVYPISAGAYYYLIMYDNKVLGKGKMAAVPSR